MALTVSRTTRGMSTYAWVLISPATTTRPVVTSRLARDPAVRVLLEDRVEHRVGDLVAHLVRVALGDRLRRERVRTHVLSLVRWSPAVRLAPTSSSSDPIEDHVRQRHLAEQRRLLDRAGGVKQDGPVRVDFEAGVGRD